ncbi:hydroxymethylpyrimidine/phosphomethylpyrimidine kinase [candidate division WOR-3 bacterium]|nr:hydroxymethylpyrimidine/phosphomethylpyrimidine kinase [candidate division WOR-3 bacterium]
MNVLTIAGFDPTGGAGILRDISIFKLLGIPYIAVPTAMTVQTSEEVLSTSGIPTRSIKEAFESTEDFRGVKIGMLYNEKVVRIVADFLRKRKPEFIVLDPIISSTSGYPLITAKGIKEMKKSLFPLSYFITPNLEEAKLLTGEEELKKIANKLHLMGTKHVIITGIESANDLFYDGKKVELIEGSKINFSFHGSGCFYSSYLLGELILGSKPLEAAKKSKKAVEAYMKAQQQKDN